MADLTPQQELFIAEYLIDLNATQAAIRAGYSAKTAAEQASRLLTNVKIASEISKRHGKRLGKLEITADRVLNELAKLAFFDPRKFWREDGSLRSVTELDDDTAMALGGFEVEEAFEHFGKGNAAAKGLLKKVKMADKGLNLERLGRHLKLFTDKIEVKSEGLAELIAAGRKRAAARKSGQ